MCRIDSNYESSDKRAMNLNLACQIDDIYQKKTILIIMDEPNMTNHWAAIFLE